MQSLQPKESNILLETGTNELEVLELYINEHVEGQKESVPSYFGVNVAKVMQVIESPELEPPESAPHASFIGVISLRNLTVPILDLSILMGMERSKHDHEVVIITEFSQSVTGFLVSGVTDIHRLGWGQVEAPSGYLADVGTDTIIGMVNMKDRFIQLLDLESILARLDPDSMDKAGDVDVHTDRQYKALVADDSATIRLMLTKMLGAAGFDLHVVSTGEDALNYLLKARDSLESGQSITDKVDIVIADIEMPRMDGFSLTKNIKTDPVLGTLPVILYSSLITKELKHKGDSVGADLQVTKPEMDQMARRAIELLQQRRDVAA